jgi:hypothetical protein
MEYLCAEVLELAGNVHQERWWGGYDDHHHPGCAGAEHAPSLDSEHVKRAILGDDELRRLWPSSAGAPASGYQDMQEEARLCHLDKAERHFNDLYREDMPKQPPQRGVLYEKDLLEISFFGPVMLASDALSRTEFH